MAEQGIGAGRAAEESGGVARSPAPIEPRWLGDYAAYGVTCNELPAEVIFAEYERCGFLYPAKRARLAPLMDRVLDTWRRSTTAAAREHWVHHCLVSQRREGTRFATVSMWRTSTSRVHSQHMVSNGAAAASRDVLLGCQDVVAVRGMHFSENWFRTENRYPARVFGSTPDALGSDRAALEHKRLVAMGPLGAMPAGVRVERIDDAGGPEARALLEALSGPVIAAAEELDAGDIDLHELNEAYKVVGLSRRRAVLLATGPGGRPLGLCSCYTGPIGLNFSLLENKVDLWLRADLDDDARRSAALAMIGAAQRARQESGDLALPSILVACDPATGKALIDAGDGQHVRDYVRCVWTRAGFWDWYRHVDGIYARVLERGQRRGTPSLAAAKGGG